MPPKAASKKGGKAKGKGKPAAKRAPPAQMDLTRIPAMAMLLPMRGNPRRAQYAKKFNEIVDLVLSTDPTYCLRSRTANGDNGTAVPSVPADLVDYFPLLQVGFLARAMGLNVQNEQINLLTRLTQVGGDGKTLHDSVSRRLLEGVVIDALMNGVIGGPSLVDSGVLTLDQMPADCRPSCCVREDEAVIFQAFSTLDTTRKGFLTQDELRLALSNLGEPFSQEEMEEMLAAIMMDPDAEAIYYKDFADILAKE